MEQADEMHRLWTQRFSKDAVYFKYAEWKWRINIEQLIEHLMTGCTFLTVMTTACGSASHMTQQTMSIDL